MFAEGLEMQSSGPRKWLRNLSAETRDPPTPTAGLAPKGTLAPLPYGSKEEQQKKAAAAGPLVGAKVRDRFPSHLILSRSGAGMYRVLCQALRRGAGGGNMGKICPLSVRQHWSSRKGMTLMITVMQTVTMWMSLTRVMVELQRPMFIER